VKAALFKVIGLSLLLMLAPYAKAQTLNPIQFQDQHGADMALTDTVTWMIFSHHNDGAKLVKAAIDQAGITDFSQHNGLYVADISRMPALVTRLFAMPAMRKYEFNMALDREGDLTQSLPREEARVTLVKLDNLTIVEQSYVDSVDAILAFINTNR
jgi:hypothetical protein